MKLERDEIRAREALKPHLSKLRGLLQMWINFSSARDVADEFATNFDDLNRALRMACNKALIVDYYRPWSGNHNPDLELLAEGSRRPTRYPFMDAVTAKPEHEYLKELRNKLIAHAEEGYEAFGVTVKGATVINHPLQERRIPSVFLPVQFILGNVRGISWIKDKGKIKEIKEHIDFAMTEVQKELHKVAAKFHSICIDHMHVLGNLTDVVQIDSMPNSPRPGGVGLHFDLKSHGRTGNKPIISSAPTKTMIGDEYLEQFAVVYEHNPGFPDELEVQGRGWRLRVVMDEQGTGSFDVSFVGYPYFKLTKHLEKIVHYSNLLKDDPNSAASPETNLRGLLVNQAYFDEKEADKFIEDIKSQSKRITEQTVRKLLAETLHAL